MTSPDTQNPNPQSNEAAFARHMLERIAYIRAFEAKAQDLSQTKPPVVEGSMHLCAGQEAVPLGAVAGLNEDDQIICTYRGHGWALAAGLDAQEVMAEICHRVGGVNGGRGGSAYFMAPHTRFIGENSIVGAGTTMACGVALANLAAGNSRVVTVTVGDGALNQGSVHEAMAFAVAKSLPVIFVVENNGWSELTATTDMFPIQRLAKRASGYGMPSATIDGTDPAAVRDSIAMAAERARNGDGPSLLEFTVPRLWGHYNKDIEHYRSKADRQAAEARDPLSRIGRELAEQGVMAAAEVEETIRAQSDLVDEMAETVIALPLPDPAEAARHVVAAAASHEPKVIETVEMKYVEAVNAALRTELENDPRTILFGEDVGKGGGIFGASRYLQRDFGEERVFDTPIAENAILGSAVGAAVSGLKPIAEIMWADFMFVAIDQLINQAPNVRYITGGQSSVPMVVRTQQGVTPGSCAQHSQSIEAILAHIPGLKVALASSAHDAYALLRAAVADPDPCVVIENRGLYQTKGEVEITDGAESVGKARLRRDGKDCAVLTWGAMVNKALDAADVLSKEGIDVSVLDLRWLSPLDEDAIMRAVRAAGGQAVIAHEAVRTGGFAGEISMRILESCGDLSPSISRVTTPDIRMPASPVLQAALVPSAQSIADVVRAQVKQKVA